MSSHRRSSTHFDAFSKMEVYRAVTSVFIPTPLSGSMVIFGDFGFVYCFTALRILVDWCWRIEICVHFCLGWVILGFLVEICYLWVRFWPSEQVFLAVAATRFAAKVWWPWQYRWPASEEREGEFKQKNFNLRAKKKIWS